MLELAGRVYHVYLRKSKGYAGIAEQRDRNHRHIARIGGTVGREFLDDDSTAFQQVAADAPPQRDDFYRLLAHLLTHPGEGISAYHTDRLNRNMIDAEQLIRVCARGASPVVISGGRSTGGSAYDLTTSDDRDRFRHAALKATGEVDHMTERIRDAKADARARGDWLGGPRPFGWMPDGVTLCRRELHCTEAEAARRGLTPAGTVRGRARDLVVVELPYDEAGEFAAALGQVIAGESLYSIQRDWRARGVLTATGRPWASAVNIRHTLVRPRAAGLAATEDGRITGPGNWEPITDELTWRKAHAILTDPGRRTHPGGPRRWLGSGLYRCGVCGAPCIASSTRQKKGSRTRRAVYRCGPTRAHIARDATALDDYIGLLISAMLADPDVIAGMCGDAPDTTPLQLELERIAAELDDAAAAAAAGQITVRQLGIASEGLLGRQAAVEAQLTAAARDGVLGALLAGGAAPDLWAGLTLDGRRTLLGALLTVTILPAPRGRPAGWKPGQPYLAAMTDYIRVEAKYHGRVQ